MKLYLDREGTFTAEGAPVDVARFTSLITKEFEAQNEEIAEAPEPKRQTAIIAPTAKRAVDYARKSDRVGKAHAMSVSRATVWLRGRRNVRLILVDTPEWWYDNDTATEAFHEIEALEGLSTVEVLYAYSRPRHGSVL